MTDEASENGEFYVETTKVIDLLDFCIAAFPTPYHISLKGRFENVDWKQADKYLTLDWIKQNSVVNFEASAGQQFAVRGLFHRIGFKRNVGEFLMKSLDGTHQISAFDGFSDNCCWVYLPETLLENLQMKGLLKAYCSRAQYLATLNRRVDQSRCQIQTGHITSRSKKEMRGSFFDQPLEIEFCEKN